MQALPNFTFANQSGLDMLETTLVALQDITLEKIFDDNGKKTLASEFPRIMQQVKQTNPFFPYQPNDDQMNRSSLSVSNHTV